MVAASFWAPAQPEVWQDGASCEVDLCGALEDPQRWRLAWMLWALGALATLTATVTLARPRPGSVLRRTASALLILLSVPVTAIAAYIVSLNTSAQGFATVMWIFSLLPLVALATSTLRAWVVRTARTGGSTPRHASLAGCTSSLGSVWSIRV